MGHGQTSYKCHLNGTKKRQRKPRKNTTKYGENAKIPTKRAKKGAAANAPNASNDQEMTAAPNDPMPQEFPLIDASNASNGQEMTAALNDPMPQEFPLVDAPNASHDQEMTAAPNELSSPTRLTREQIIQNSPNRVTRG